jgi:hypothetical protein
VLGQLQHLALDPGEIVDAEPCAVIDRHWRPTAIEQLRRLRTGEPATDGLIALPGVSPRSRRLPGPLVGILDDG